MIPFGSQRAPGQDLATHPLICSMHRTTSGWKWRRCGEPLPATCTAPSPSGRQAQALMQCTNYIYSPSVNPDQRQGRLTREQYLDYIERTEQRLGLSGQPRAIVFHVKQDKYGVAREHCHVVWSRIDVQKKKVRHVAFDHEKLMTVEPILDPALLQQHTDVFNWAAEQPIDLTEEFERAAGASSEEEESSDAGTEPAPDGEATIQRRKTHPGPVPRHECPLARSADRRHALGGCNPKAASGPGF